MKTKHSTNATAAAAALVLVVTTMAACTSAATPIPTTETRLGTLSFEQGFPTEETTRRVFDEMDYQRAVQAYLWAYPVVSFESIRLATKRDLGTDLNDLIIASLRSGKRGERPEQIVRQNLSVYDDNGERIGRV